MEKENRVALPRFLPYVNEGDFVVDFGCGTGWLLKLLPGGQKIGIEPNPFAREYAAELGVETVESPSELADDTADVIVSNHALEHSLSPFAELLEIRRILKPDGRFVLGLPVDDWRAQKKIQSNDPNHHLFTWTPQVISNLLEEAGFSVSSVRIFPYHRPPRYWLYGKVPQSLFDALSNLYGRIKRYRQIYVVCVPTARHQ